MQNKLNKSEILYHYTSLETLLKIIDNKGNDKICLRATHAKFFNDPYEYDLAISMLKKSMIKYEREYSIKNRKSQHFKKGPFSSLGQLFGNPYILSLSKNSNDLTMWRTYGANGCGVAIGLDRNALVDYSNNTLNKNTRLLKCQYDEKYIINGLTGYWAKHYDKISIKEGGKSISMESLDFIIDISNFCFSFKRTEYLSENEWRLCKNDWDDKNVKFRESSGLIIPYIEHHFSKEIIKKIIIGPCLDRFSKESIVMLLKSRGFKIPEESVILSKVPYRKI